MVGNYDVPKEIIDIVEKLRKKYGSIDGIQVVSNNFIKGLEGVVLNNRMALGHDPKNKLAIARNYAVREYLEELKQLQSPTIPPQLLSSYLSH